MQLLADSLNFALKEEWNMTRWIVYSVLQPYLKKTEKQKSMEQLFPLPFDGDYEDLRDIEVSNEQIETMREHARLVQEKLFKKNNGEEHS